MTRAPGSLDILACALAACACLFALIHAPAPAEAPKHERDAHKPMYYIPTAKVRSWKVWNSGAKNFLWIREGNLIYSSVGVVEGV